ncbi:hypothetical protein ACJJTC_009072 [Scirpophaga incertulas]
MAPLQFVCGGCRKKCTTTEHLKCMECAKVYDLDCANVSVQRFRNTMTRDHKTAWKCYECKGDEGCAPPNINVSTPNSSQKGELAEFMTEMREFRKEISLLRVSLTARLEEFEQRLGALERCNEARPDLEIGELPEEKGGKRHSVGDCTWPRAWVLRSTSGMLCLPSVWGCLRGKRLAVHDAL